MQDPLRAVLDSVFADPAYRWREREDPFGFLSRWAGALVDRLVEWGDANPVAVRVLVSGLAVVLLLLFLRVFISVVGSFRAGPSGPGARPVPILRDAAWYRREAERLAAEGRLLDAMQADFTALILEFDHRRLVRYHPGKTPREYVREAVLPEPARADLSDLVWALYRHVFGREPISPAAASEWRARTAANRYAPAS